MEEREPARTAPRRRRNDRRPTAHAESRAVRHESNATRRLGSTAWLGKVLSPLLWSIIAHGLLLIAMALAKFQWRPKPPRTLIVSAGVESEMLDNTPLMNTPVLEQPQTEFEEISPAVSEPIAAPTLPEVRLPENAAAQNVSMAEPSLASPLEAISQAGSAELASLVPQDKRRQQKRGAVFFGVGATGNSFCFVVDSSRSMRGGKFDLARREVLRAISAMQPNQRFYVMLFDQNVERMEIEPGTPSQQPAKATDDNKQRLARWIATTKMEPSARPGKAIEAALCLETDVLFLLTDGELPDDLTAAVRAQNLVRTEGQAVPQPKVVIHTVGLYSQRGHQLLYQLAQENGGRYRFIPRPPR